MKRLVCIWIAVVLLCSFGASSGMGLWPAMAEAMPGDMSTAPSTYEIEEALRAVLKAQGKNIASMSGDKENKVFKEVRELLAAFLTELSIAAQKNDWGPVPEIAYTHDELENGDGKRAPLWFRDLVLTLDGFVHAEAEEAKAPPISTLWKGVARVLQPLTSDETLGAYGQATARELYAACCTGSRANDLKPHDGVDAFYKGMISPVDDLTKTRVLEELARYEEDGWIAAEHWAQLNAPPEKEQDEDDYDDYNYYTDEEEVDPRLEYFNPYLPELIALYTKDRKGDCVSENAAFVAMNDPHEMNGIIRLCEAIAATKQPAEAWMGLLVRLGNIPDNPFRGFCDSFANYCAAWAKPSGLPVAAMGPQLYGDYVKWSELARAAKLPTEMVGWLISLGDPGEAGVKGNGEVLWSWEALNGLSGQKSFKPANPQEGLFIMISGPKNQYNLVKQADMDESTLHEQMEAMHNRINNIGTMTHDPDQASFALEYTCTYSLVGTYVFEDGEQMKGYGCTLEIKVTDLQTGKAIAAITLKQRPGNQMYLSDYDYDDTKFWPYYPEMDDEKGDAFLEKLDMYFYQSGV